jgi:uncharacterized protein
MSCILKKTHLFVWKCINYALIFIGTFGSITAATYSLSGEINWPVAILFVLGGIIGDVWDKNIIKSTQRYTEKIFAILLIVVATYIIIKSMLF